MTAMDRVIFGDNQFFAVNHLSDEKSRAQAMRFRRDEAIIDVLDYVYDIGIRTFMCTTHERIGRICDHFRANPARYQDFKFYPCMPYAHKYANAVTEYGPIEALKQLVPGGLIDATRRGGLALARGQFEEIMGLLVDAEMKMFEGLSTPVIFLQNVVTDLLLGLGMHQYFVAFSEYVREKYDAEPGFITMNLPQMARVLADCGEKDPIICASINKIGFRMSGGLEANEAVLAQAGHRTIAMQALAAGAIPPKEAMEYVCSLPGVSSVLYGASTKGHIEQTHSLILQSSRP